MDYFRTVSFSSIRRYGCESLGVESVTVCDLSSVASLFKNKISFVFTSLHFGYKTSNSNTSKHEEFLSII